MPEVSRVVLVQRSFEERSAGMASNQTSEYSNGNFSMHLDLTQGLQLTDCAFGVYPRQTEIKIKVAEVDDSRPPERMKDNKGRIRTWPGLLLTMVIVGGALAAIVMAALDQDRKIKIGVERYEQRMQNYRKIDDGLEDDQVLISDGQVGNPKSYPDMGCELPDYQSKDGQIFAVSKNGTEVPVGIKGINWFGMETGLAVPFGLWENMYNGTLVYEITAFLSRNNFNSVRLPVYQEHPQEHGPAEDPHQCQHEPRDQHHVLHLYAPNDRGGARVSPYHCHDQPSYLGPDQVRGRLVR